MSIDACDGCDSLDKWDIYARGYEVSYCNVNWNGRSITEGGIGNSCHFAKELFIMRKGEVKVEADRDSGGPTTVTGTISYDDPDDRYSISGSGSVSSDGDRSARVEITIPFG